MGKKNKVLKLTDRKIRYIIQAKKRGESTNRISDISKITGYDRRMVEKYTKASVLPSSNKKQGNLCLTGTVPTI